MATIEDLRNKGYDLGPGPAFEGDGFNVWRVEGPGISTQVRDDDGDTMQSLIDGYDEAVKQQDETDAERQLRWHRDPDHPLELTDEHREALEQQVATEREAAAG
jgi:hypothetical protein